MVYSSTINPGLPAAGGGLSSAVVRANFAAARADVNALASQVPGSVLSVLGYGADPTNAADSTAAFNVWWAALLAAPAGTAGYVPGGTYRIAGSLTWNYAGSRANYGIAVFGDGQLQSVLNFTATSGTVWQTTATGGTGPANLVGYYYNVIRDIGFVANTTGKAFKIGLDSGADAIQSSTLQNLAFLNGNPASGGALRVNGANACEFLNISAGAYPATAGQAGSGAGLELVQATFCTFVSPSVGNGNIGIAFGDNGYPGVMGFSYGNVFLGSDIENTQYGIVQTSGSASGNTFIGGRGYTIYPGGYLVKCTQGGNSNPGGCLVIDGMNISQNPLYGSGGTAPALDPNNQVGVLFRGGSYGAVTTPAFPASGATYTNRTGQTQFVTFGGGSISAVAINGHSLPAPASVQAAMLVPGGAIGFTYTGSPAWYFQNFVN